MQLAYFKSVFQKPTTHENLIEKLENLINKSAISPTSTTELSKILNSFVKKHIKSEGFLKISKIRKTSGRGKENLSRNDSAWVFSVHIAI